MDGLGIAAVVFAVICAIVICFLVWFTLKANQECTRAGGHEVQTGIILIKGVPYPTYTCEYQ